MSILQEYEEIRKSLPKGVYEGICAYLDLNPELYLSDIYYKEECYNKFYEWYEKNYKME